LAGLNQKYREAMKGAHDAEQELAKIIAKAEALEALAEEKNAEVDAGEEELDEIQTKVQEHVDQLGASEKFAEEGRQARKQMERRGASDSKLIQELEEQLEGITAQNEESQAKLEELSTSLVEAEETLDMEDERIEEAEIRVKQLESEVTQVGNSLRSMEICEKDSVDRVCTGDNKMVEMEAKFTDMEAVALEYEGKAEELEGQLEEKEEELAQAKTAYNEAKSDFDVLLAEIAEM